MHTLHKLLFVKLCTCDCVWFWFGQPSLKIPWFISYSCILFIKYYALRSFCIKLLCFSKNWFFPEFRSIEPISRPIEIAIKNLVWFCVFRSVIDRYWINQRHFQSIEPNFRSIENRRESFFFKKKLWVSHVHHIFKTFETLFSLSLIGLRVKANFCRFPPILLQGFCPLRPVRPLHLSFFIYFQVSCIFFMYFRDNFETMKIWEFWWFKPFLSQLINEFLLWDDIQLFYVN